MWTKQISASSSSIWVKRKTDATAALAGTVWEASSVFTEGSTPTWDELTGEVNAHITPVTLTQPSIISRLFKSVADKSGNYDSLIAGNVGKSQKSTETCEPGDLGEVWAETWQLTACFLMALYKRLVNIQTNKPQLSFTVVFLHIPEWSCERRSRVPKTNILRTATKALIQRGIVLRCHGTHA